MNAQLKFELYIFEPSRRGHTEKWRLPLLRLLPHIKQTRQIHKKDARYEALIGLKHVGEPARCVPGVFCAVGLSTGGDRGSAWHPGETSEPGEEAPLSAEHR